MAPTLNLILGLNIKTHRLMRNYSQAYMASAVGISQNMFSRLELGKISITIDRLINIAEILEVDINELLPPKGYKQ